MRRGELRRGGDGEKGMRRMEMMHDQGITGRAIVMAQVEERIKLELRRQVIVMGKDDPQRRKGVACRSFGS
jgi:hypothetical protein